MTVLRIVRHRQIPHAGSHPLRKILMSTAYSIHRSSVIAVATVHQDHCPIVTRAVGVNNWSVRHMDFETQTFQCQLTVAHIAPTPGQSHGKLAANTIPRREEGLYFHEVFVAHRCTVVLL